MTKTAQPPTTSVADQISNLAIAADLAELTARRYRAAGNMPAAVQCLRDADDCLKRMQALKEDTGPAATHEGLQVEASVGEEPDAVLIRNCEQAVVAYREAHALMNAGTDLPPGAEFDSIALLAQRQSEESSRLAKRIAKMPALTLAGVRARASVVQPPCPSTM
jgi:hypothetical protein